MFDIDVNDIKIPKRKWREYLLSNQGLFKRFKEKPEKNKHIIGPSLTESGQITGDVLMMESGFFYQHAQEEQKKFADGLSKKYPFHYNEYVLVISNSLLVWQEDVHYLQKVLELVDKEEDELIEEEKELEKAEKRAEFLNEVPDILKRHLAPVFETLSRDYDNLQALITDIKKAETALEKFEHYLKNYLKDLKEHIPIVFEDIKLD